MSEYCSSNASCILHKTKWKNESLCTIFRLVIKHKQIYIADLVNILFERSDVLHLQKILKSRWEIIRFCRTFDANCWTDYINIERQKQLILFSIVSTVIWRKYCHNCLWLYMYYNLTSVSQMISKYIAICQVLHLVEIIEFLCLTPSLLSDILLTNTKHVYWC